MKNPSVLKAFTSGVCLGIAPAGRFWLGLLLFFAIIPVAWSATYYVDPAGNNVYSGTSLSQPFKTIQKAMNTAVAGDTVYVRGGIYREYVEVFRGGGSAGNLLKVFAYNGEVPIVMGSDLVTGWVQHSGNIWKKSGWAYNSQQVFVGDEDGPSLQQIGMPSTLYTTFEYPRAVGSGVGSMIPGSFYYDAASTTLYVWLSDGSDPNTTTVQASTRRRLFFMGMPYIHLKGFAFRHSNSSAHAKMGAAVELSSNSIIEQSDIQYTDFAGLSLGYLQTGAQAINCNVSNNGNSGINGAGSYKFRVSNVRMNNNNTRNFNALWHAGGLKATTKAYGTVEFSEIAHNNGSGIWFDYANSGNPIVIRNNYIHDNGPVDSAIFLEVSKNALVYNNVIANNQRRGIYISASDNSQVYNNTVVGTGGYAGIELGGMPRSGATLTNNAVYNNIISHGTSRYDLAIAVANGSTIANNRSDYNDIYSPDGLSLLYGSVTASLYDFVIASSQDSHSISLDPDFVSASEPASAASYSVLASSGIIDKGTALASVSQDFLNVARPSGAAYDMGAFEKVVVTNTVDTTPPVITINSPAPSTTVIRDASLTIAASATDNVGVKAMSLAVDGIALARTTTGQVSFSWNSTGARIGTHTITISASDGRNNVSRKYLNFVVK